jgi:hypothetical protein
VGALLVSVVESKTEIPVIIKFKLDQILKKSLDSDPDTVVKYPVPDKFCGKHFNERKINFFVKILV